ncbi:glycosyltransferase [Noviherbaspirillum sp. ST 5-3]|uniref:glycosyltransferase n=1 Tax=Noviherbaspirillum sp. ST 5-3 TaxID=3349878 RepID=UPI003917286F
MSGTIKVLHVFKTYYPDSMGGVEAVIRQLTAATAPMGVSNRIFTLSWQGNASPVLREGTVEVLRAQTHLEIASTPISFNALHLFRDSVARADLVHYHYPWPFGDVLNLLAGHAKPAILTYWFRPCIPVPPALVI